MPGLLPRRRARPSGTRSARASFSRRLRLEPLEERRLLAAGPTILSTTPPLTDGFLPVGAQQLSIAFDSAVLGGDEAANYQLQGLGPDALLGTADDVMRPMTVSYAADTATLSFTALPEGVYRLTVRDTITDIVGNKLDGNADGTTGGDWAHDFVACWFDGRLDVTLGGDGTVSTDFRDFYETVGVAIQNDGKIVVAGSIYRGSRDLMLARYNIDGSLDRSFDGDGVATTDFNLSEDTCSGMVLEPDGKIIVTGASYDHDSSKTAIAVVRYNSDGSLDPTFDGDGKLTTHVSPYLDAGASVTLQADGKIVVAATSDYCGVQFAVVRYNADGSLDTTFDGDGKLTTHFGEWYASPVRVAMQADGKIVVAGVAYQAFSSVHTFVIARYLPDGSLDTSFDGDGTVATDIGTWVSSLRDMAIQPDGKIVVAGLLLNGVSKDFLLLRYNSDGSLDETFDSDGKLTTDFGFSHDEANSVAIQRDGRIVAVGTSGPTNADFTDFAVARYNTDGSLDTSFDDDGRLTSDLGRTYNKATAVALQSDGRIVVAGFSYEGYDPNFINSEAFSLARYGAGNVARASSHGIQFEVDSEGWNAGELIDVAGAADGLGRLQVGGADYSSPTPATVEDGDRTVVTGVRSIVGLDVHREVTVPNTGDADFARTIDVFTNPTDAPITTTVRIVGNLGSDAATTVFATSDGDTNAEPADQWIGTDDADGSGTPAVIHYIHGLTGVKPASVSVVGDNIEWTYNLTIPAGQTVRLAHFTIVGTTRAEAIAAAESLVGVKGFKGQAGAFLTQSEKDNLANFDFNRPTFAGVYDPRLARFYLRNTNTQGPADNSFLFGAPGWEAISGDWDGDGKDTIGAFQREASQFYLRNSNEAGNADVSFGFGAPGSNWILLMGDWNGDGIDTIGSYDPATSQFYLRNSNSQGNADLAFGFGTPGAGWTPVVGDWDGDGVDTIGLYDPQTGMFYLRNTFSTGMADVAFAYGVPNHGWQPLVGDWNGDGVETIGMYLPPASTFFLRNSNTVGNADMAFGLGYAGCQPIIGDWLGRDAVVQPASLPDGQPSGSLQLTATDAVFSQLDEDLSSDALSGLQSALA